MPFQPGKSGNPAGRPKGSSTRYGATLLQRNGRRILRQLIDKACSGDLKAIEICIERLLPRLKAQAAPVELPLAEGDSLADQGREVLHAAFCGLIAPDQATMLMTALAAEAGIIEISELVQRVDALERGERLAPVLVRPQPRVSLHTDD
jgi:uncharacterized protein DUF5681